MTKIVQRAFSRTPLGRGLFNIRRHHPGRGIPGHRDPGLWTLGAIDHARLAPGLNVPMHEHRNDDILSYVRSGGLRHRDNAGRDITLTPNRLMLMRAGRGFSHEEGAIGHADRTEMLQIFLRPPAADLEPDLQIAELAEVRSLDRWRLIAGPEDVQPPLHLGNQVCVFDAHVQMDTRLHPPDVADYGWLYCMTGTILVDDDLELGTGDACVFLRVHAATEIRGLNADGSDLIFFTIDPRAPFTLAGTIGGVRHPYEPSDHAET